MALWEMEPDQWFRMWTTIGQGVVTGVTTLGGGYIGYRLARRGERHKAQVALVEQWRTQCAELVQDLEKADEQLERRRDQAETVMRVNNIVVRRSNPTEEAAEWAATRLTGILEGWKKTVHLHSPAKGSPALVIALIPFAAIAEQTAKLRDPDWDGFKAIAGETRGAIGLAATWISDGLPNKREVNRRHEKTKKRIVDVTGFDPTTPSKSTTPPPA